MVDIGLTRKEKEKLVIDLYKRGLTYAQIAREAHVSLRDIAPILNKTGEYQSLSNSSQAYKMFEEGSSPIQVAIALNLRENQVREYYREYWDLNGMYQLNQVYEEIGNAIWSVIELHRRAKAEGLTSQQVSRILKTTTTLERQNRDLEGEQARLEAGNKEAAKTFQRLTDSIQKDHRTLEENDSVIIRQRREIENLDIEKVRLENINDSIRLNSETRIKVKQIVKEEIESTISNPRRLVRLALASLFESSRKHPGKFQALYYNMSFPSSVEQILTQSRVSQNQSRYGYSENEDEELLLDDAEQAYNSMIDAIANRCINEVPNDTKSLSPVLQLPIIQDEGSNHEILDTGDLSQVDFVYNDITFQVYPTLKITNERSSATDMLPSEYELDNNSYRDQE
jgi:DNA-binding CsgD family transcriptional regulator